MEPVADTDKGELRRSSLPNGAATPKSPIDNTPGRPTPGPGFRRLSKSSMPRRQVSRCIPATFCAEVQRAAISRIGFPAQQTSAHGDLPQRIGENNDGVWQFNETHIDERQEENRWPARARHGEDQHAARLKLTGRGRRPTGLELTTAPLATSWSG